MKCLVCLKEKYIMNKRHTLCKECNEIRKYGKTKIQMQIEKNKEKPKKTYTIKARSKKQDDIHKKYIEVLKTLDRPKICSGCNSSNAILSHSHIISQKDCKNIGRPDLIHNPDNITYHCLDWYNSKGCHQIWENPKRRSELLDYEKNMQYIKTISLELYNKYLTK